MVTTVPFHFLLLAIGEVLTYYDYVDPQRLQDFIANDDAFGGIRVPLEDCRLALQLMEDSGFIVEYDSTKHRYMRVTNA